MTEWTTRLYEGGTEEAIRNLYEMVFNVPKSAEFWQWQYLNNPTRRVTILLAEGADGSLAGQYAVSPVAMKIGGEDVIGTLSLDTMVHPNYRGKGMFISLAQDLYERIAAEGMPVVYGFPNKQSYPGLVKHLRWVNLCESLPIYVRPLNFSKLLKKAFHSDFLSRFSSPVAKLGYQVLHKSRSRVAQSLRVSVVTEFDERVDQLWQRARDNSLILVRRDKSYLNWRYAEHPTKTYTIFIAERNADLLGYGVLTQQEVAGLSGAFIADILTDPAAPGTAEALINAMVEDAQKSQCDLVNCLMFPHAPYAGALKESGFMLAPASLFPQEIHLGVRNNSTRFPDEFIHNPQNWYITWGDHDRV